MRVKRSRRIKAVGVEDEENLDDTHDVDAQNLQQPLKIQQSLEMTNKPAAILTNEEEKENQIAAGCDLAKTGKIPTQETFNERLSPDATVHDNAEEIVAELLRETNVLGDNSIQFQSSKGQKRLLQHTLDPIENENLLCSSTHISYTDFVNLKKQCIDLESRVTKLEEQSIPNTLRGVREDNNDVENDPMGEIIKQLGVDKNKLVKYNKKTSTATARSLMRFKHPNPDPNFKLTNVDKSIVNAITEYTKFSNPHDLVPDAELRKAMTNYFASVKHQNKTKTTTVSNRVDE